MKRNIIMLIAAVIVLALFVGLYFVAVKWEPQKETDSSTPSMEETVYIINEETENVDEVYFKTTDASYSIKNAKTPKIKGYHSNVIDDSLVRSALYSVATITASRDMGKKDDLNAYGLESDNVYVLIKTKDGMEKKLIIGNPTNLDGEYYACIAGSNNVYTISSYTTQKLLKHPDEYRSLDVTEIDNTTITEFTIEKNGKKVLEVEYDESYVPTNEYQPYAYIMKYPYNGVKANLDSLNMLFESISSVNAKSIVEENPSNLAKYGLDKPFVLKVKDANKTSVVKMGHYDENKSVYVMHDDVPVVYSAECSFYETVKNLNADEFVDRFIHLFDISTVKSIMFKKDEASHTLEIEKKSEDEFGYKVDGKIKVKDTFTPIYSKIIGVTSSGYIQKEPSGKETCTVSFTFTDGTMKKFAYYDYDERNFIVKADNGLTCLVLKKSIDDIFSALK